MIQKIDTSSAREAFYALSKELAEAYRDIAPEIVEKDIAEALQNIRKDTDFYELM